MCTYLTYTIFLSRLKKKYICPRVVRKIVTDCVCEWAPASVVRFPGACIFLLFLFYGKGWVKRFMELQKKEKREVIFTSSHYREAVKLCPLMLCTIFFFLSVTLIFVCVSVYLSAVCLLMFYFEVSFNRKNTYLYSGQKNTWECQSYPALLQNH